MLQFYTEPSSEGLHIIRSVPSFLGMVAKRLAIPTTVRDRHVISNFAADEQWTGPADFNQMHENVHYKFSSDQPIFGSAENWSTWVGESFAGHQRRFDTPTSPDGHIVFITPDIGGFNTISRVVGSWQGRIAGDLRWVVRDCLVEERYLLVLADLRPSSQGVTVSMQRRYIVCKDGTIAESKNSYSQQWRTPAAIATFMDTSAPVLLDRWCPITDAMAEFAAQQESAFEYSKQVYDINRNADLERLNASIAASDASLDALYRRLKSLKTTIREEKSQKSSDRQLLSLMKKRREQIRIELDKLDHEIQTWKLRRDRQFAIHGVTRVRDLARDSRTVVNMVSSKLKSLYAVRDRHEVALKALRFNTNSCYARISQSKKRLARLFEEKASLYSRIENANEVRSALYGARDEILFQPALADGWWDTASTDFRWYTQPSQAAVLYLQKVADFREKNREILKRKPDLLKDFTDELKVDMVRPLLDYRARYDEWLAQNPVRSVDRGEAVMQAIKDTKYIDINSIAYLKDMPELFGEIKAVYELLQHPADPTKWAGLILNVSYGTRLTFADTGELLEGIHKKIMQAEWLRSWNKVQGGVGSQPNFPYDDAEFPLHRTIVASIYYGECDSRLSQALLAADDWDVLPTFSNVWDLIPYSFVVDWFMNVGTILEDMDTAWKALELPVLCYFSTTTDSVDVPHRYIEGICPHGQTIRFSHYERRKRDQIDLFMHKLEFSSLPTEVIPQASSLLIQQLDRL